MDNFKELTTGAKLVLGSAVALLIVSWFNWFDIESLGIDNMWGGVGIIAGLLLIVLIVWQAIRLANIELEIGVTPSMITAALAVLTFLFVVIRFLITPDVLGVSSSRTFWAWLGLALAILLVVGAWLNMQAAGEGIAHIRASVAGAAAAAKGAVDRDDKPTASSAPTAPEAPSAAAEAPVEPPAEPPAETPSAPDADDETPRAS